MNSINRQDRPRRSVMIPELLYVQFFVKSQSRTYDRLWRVGSVSQRAKHPIHWELGVLSKSLKMLSPHPLKVIFVFTQGVSPECCYVQKRECDWSAGKSWVLETFIKINFMGNSVSFPGFTYHLISLSSSTQKEIKVLNFLWLSMRWPKLVFFLPEENKDTSYIWNQI